jgi:hypothetical protein
MLLEAKPRSIVIRGTAYIEHPWFNNAKCSLELDGRSTLVKFVVVRGGIPDWCIYHSLSAAFDKSDYLDGTKHLEVGYQHIADYGAKLYNTEVIRAIIDCDEDVFSMYRRY